MIIDLPGLGRLPSRRRHLRFPPYRKAAVLGYLLVASLSFDRPALSEETTNQEPARSPGLEEKKLDSDYGVGSWIWTNETRDQQFCSLWRSFDIPASDPVVGARFRLTADNTYRFFLDGRELGRGGDWRDITEYDLTLLLKPGTHVLAVEAFNTFRAAGILAGLHVDLASGKSVVVLSDSSWRIVPEPRPGWESKRQAEPGWPAATVVGQLGIHPWNYKPVLVKVAQFQSVNFRFWQTGWFQITLFLLCLGILAVCLRLLGKLAIHSQSQQILKRERARIARDIHDDLTAGLTQLVLAGEVARSKLESGTEPSRQVTKVCEKARDLSRSMNEIIWVVNSQRDTFRDFASYACKYAETFLEPTGIRCRFDVDEEIPELPCDLGVRRNLFLAVKEAINNAVRHSGANELLLRIHLRGQTIVVTIQDNGRGFDPQAVDLNRNGLSNMAKRALEAGGVCRIRSRAGSGCEVEFEVPLARAGKNFFRLHLPFWRPRPAAPKRPAPDAMAPGWRPDNPSP